MEPTDPSSLEMTLAYRLRLESCLSSISTSFVNVASDHIDTAVNRALAELGTFFGCGRGFIFTYAGDDALYSNTHEWCAPGVISRMARLQAVNINPFRWSAELLDSFQPIHVSDVCELPAEAEAEKELLDSQGIISIVALPLVYRAQLLGVFGLESHTQKKEWVPEDIALLKTFGESVVHLLNRKRSEAAMREMLRNMPVMVCALDGDTRIVEWNYAAESVSGYSRDEILGNESALSACVPDEKVRDLLYRQTTEHAVPFLEVEVMLRARGGQTKWLRWMDVSREFPVPGWASWGLAIDISEQKKGEQNLRKLSQAVEQSPACVVITDTAGKIEYVNRKFEEVTGYTLDEVRGQNPRILKSEKSVEPEKYQALWGAITSGNEWRGEFCNRKKNGELYWESAVISPIKDAQGSITHFLAVKEDVTAKKNLEAQFLRAQRLESLGTLAGGIAHDLNNVLSPIQMAVHILRRTDSKEKIEQFLGTIESSASRASSIVKQVLTFARGTESDKSVVQLRHLVKEMEQIAVETFPRQIRIVRDLPAQLWPVLADSTQIHQILMNLCVNARDAMPDGGTLTLKAENITLDLNYARMHLDAKPGPYVLLMISDTGTGIPPGQLERIFEPFFTTKGVGKGTGLGLSTVAAIVKSHNGFVNVYSEIGRGTQFKIYLPATPDGETDLLDAAQHIPQGNGQLVIVVDDETEVCRSVAESLQLHGYKTLIAHDGTEGLALFVEHKNDVWLVFTDIMMPHLDGTAMVRALRKIAPSVRILTTSGLAIHQAKFEEDGIPFLPKPYTIEKLLMALHSAGCVEVADA